MRQLMKVYLLTLLLLLINTSLSAQWTKVSGSNGGKVEGMLVKGNSFFVATEGGVFHSTDFGENWTSANSGITSPVTSIDVTPNQNLIAGTKDAGIFISTNNGLSWTESNDGLNELYITSLTSTTTSIYAITGATIYRSTNDGINWTSINGDVISNNINCVVAKDSLVIVSTLQMVYRSTDYGNSWAEADSGLFRTIVGPPRFYPLDSFAWKDSIIYGGSKGKIYYSVDDAISWTKLAESISDKWITSIVATDSELFISDGVFVYHSSDNGISWIGGNNIADGLPKNVFRNTSIFSLVSLGDKIYAGTVAGVFVSNNYGASWVGINKGIDASPVPQIALSESNIFFVGGNGYYILRSADSGANWDTINDSIYFHFSYLDVNNSILVACTDGPIIINSLSTALRSVDLGASWSYLDRIGLNALTINSEDIFCRF